MKHAIAALFAGMTVCAAIQAVPSAQAETYKEKVLYSFCNQDNCPGGAYPQAAVLDLNGMLYGTAAGGGRSQCPQAGCGTAFSLDPDTGTETVLHYFCSRHKCADGGNPNALIAANGKIYGTNSSGGGGFGGQQYGTAFTLDPQTGAEKVIHDFCQQQNCPDGGQPSSGLTAARGKMYGVTVNGGTAFRGTVFELDPKSGAVTVLYSFCQQQDCLDGRNPSSPVTIMGDMLYGTTIGGGEYCGGSCGTAFSIDLKTGTQNVLHSFDNDGDAELPRNLIAVHGILYGTSYGGGTGGGSTGCGVYGCGTVFSIDPNTGAETVLYSFCSRNNCADGTLPAGGLIAVKGMLYGTTESGGDGKSCYYGCGTVFSIDPGTGAEKVIYSFKGGTDGEVPDAGLTEVNGTFYGTTNAGGGVSCYGSYGCGTVFELSKQ
ncbi:MAG TPA: choice-of-anchor tandem repeat GloVer-containing protein [Rhizomicrobium sp.]